MKLRSGKFGQFWGCTGYPKCMRTMNLRDAANQHDPPNFDANEDHELKVLWEPPDGSD